MCVCACVYVLREVNGERVRETFGGVLIDSWCIDMEEGHHRQEDHDGDAHGADKVRAHPPCMEWE